MRNLKSLAVTLATAASLLSFSTISRAASTNFFYSSSEVAGVGPCIADAIWTNVVGATPIAATKGNNYFLVYDGTNMGANTLNTKVRTTSGTVNTIGSFQGDSLTVNSNTDIRMKGGGGVWTFTNSTTPSSPGLIMNGGLICVGDTGGSYTLQGVMQAVPGSVSFFGLSVNEFGGTASSSHTFTIGSQLIGSGDLWVVESLPAANLSTVSVTNPANTYSGQWFVQAGILKGTVAGSLGTNNIMVDPTMALPGGFTGIASATAEFNPTYNINSAGTLTLNNGGLMVLHQTCFFSGLTINGAPLSVGTYSWATLNGTYPAAFPSGGSGSITVQPYTTNVLPTISQQPAPGNVPLGNPVNFSVTASDPLGGTLTYQWQTNGVNVTDGGNYTDSQTSQLSLATTSQSDALITYDVIVSNAFGSVTSSVVGLTVTSPVNYVMSAAPSELVGVPFTLTVTAKNSGGSTINTNTTLTLTATGGALYDANNNGTFGESGDNILTLTNGVATIRVEDTNQESVTLIATDPNNFFGVTNLSFAAGPLDHFAVVPIKPTGIGVPFAVTITAQDISGYTRITDSSTVVTLTSSLVGMQFDANRDGTNGDNTKTLTAGVAIVNAVDNTVGTGTITATGGGKTGSGAVTILSAYVGDYQSVASGNWSDPTIWQTFDGTNWVAAVSSPTTAAGVVTIVSPNVVTEDISAQQDQVVVNSGAQFIIPSGQALTVNSNTAYQASTIPTYTGALTTVALTATPPVIDGTVDSVWSKGFVGTVASPGTGSISSTNELSGTFQTLYDVTNLYVLAQVTDDSTDHSTDSSTSLFENDAVEVYVDANNTMTATYKSNDFHFTFSLVGGTNLLFVEANGHTNGVKAAWVQTGINANYILEVKIPWTLVGQSSLAPGAQFGFDAQFDHAYVGGTRDGDLFWSDNTDQDYEFPTHFGTAVLGGASADFDVSGINQNAGTISLNGGTLAVESGGQYTHNEVALLPPFAWLNGSTCLVANGEAADLGGVATTFSGLSGFGPVTNGIVTMMASGPGLIPGVTGTAGTLTLDSALILASGTKCTFDLSGSTSAGNDQVIVTRAGTVTPNGATITINPLVTLAHGDYVLFNLTGSGSTSGSFNTTPAWVGGTPSYAASYTVVTSSKQVTLHYSAVAARPVLNSATRSGGNIVLQGTGGTASGTYKILTSTSAATPLVNWTTNTSGTFAGDGSFSNSIVITPTDPKRFFLIKTP